MKKITITILLFIFIAIFGIVGHPQNQFPEIPFIDKIKDTVINKEGYLYWVLIDRDENGVNIIKEYRNGVGKKYYSMKYWVVYDSLNRPVSIKYNGKRNSPEVLPGLGEELYVYDYLNRIVSYSKYRRKWFKFQLIIRTEEDFDNRTVTVYHSEDTKEIHYHNTKGMTYKTETYKLIDGKWEMISHF